MRVYSTVIGLSWIGFWIYWLISAASTKRSLIFNFRRFIGIRVVILIVIAALIIGNEHLKHSVSIRLSNNQGLLALGLLIFLAGISFAIWARATLSENWGMPMTLKKDPELVTTGPYKLVRHPIYTGIILMALGSAIDVSTLWWIVVIGGSIFFSYSAITEDGLMLKQFPKTYPDYKARTKMFFPYLF